MFSRHGCVQALAHAYTGLVLQPVCRNMCSRMLLHVPHEHSCGSTYMFTNICPTSDHVGSHASTWCACAHVCLSMQRTGTFTFACTCMGNTHKHTHTHAQPQSRPRAHSFLAVWKNIMHLQLPSHMHPRARRRAHTCKHAHTHATHARNPHARTRPGISAVRARATHVFFIAVLASPHQHVGRGVGDMHTSESIML